MIKEMIMSGQNNTPKRLLHRIGSFACLAILAVLQSNCSDQPWSFSPDGSDYIVRTYEASIAGETKTSLGSDGKVSWLAGDVIQYFCQEGGAVSQYSITEDSEKATMALNVQSNATFLTAVYGAGSVTNLSQSGFALTGVVTGEQSGTFAGGHVAVARTTQVEEPTLRFYNLTSFITFSTSRKDAAYAIFSSNDDTALHSNGTVTVSFEEDIPKAALSGTTGNSIKIYMNGAGQYYIAALPGVLQNGFTVALYKSDGKLIGTATGSNPLTIKRSALANLGSLDSHLVDENGINLKDYGDDGNWDNTSDSSADIDLGQYGDDYNWDSDTNSNGDINQGGYGDDSNWNSQGNGIGDVNHGGYGDDSDWDSNSGSGGDINISGYGDDYNWN